jgi:hypothetical protein
VKCIPQSGKSKVATACTFCAQRKTNCKPLADWALEREALKSQGDTPKPKTAQRRSIAGASIIISTYCVNHPPAPKEDLAQKVESLQAIVVRDNAEFQGRLQTIEVLIHDNIAKQQSGGNKSNANLRLPPVPPFDAPSPAISTTSAVSTASTSSAINISRMSLASPTVAGPSGTGAGPSQAQGECSNTWCTSLAQLMKSGNISDSRHLHPAHQAGLGVRMGGAASKPALRTSSRTRTT